MTVIDDRLAAFRAKVEAENFAGEAIAWQSGEAAGIRRMRDFVLVEFDLAVKLMEEDRQARMEVTMKAYEKALKRAKKSDDATRRVATDAGGAT